jgi:hypothetical protein
VHRRASEGIRILSEGTGGWSWEIFCLLAGGSSLSDVLDVVLRVGLAGSVYKCGLSYWCTTANIGKDHSTDQSCVSPNNFAMSDGIWMRLGSTMDSFLIFSSSMIQVWRRIAPRGSELCALVLQRRRRIWRGPRCFIGRFLSAAAFETFIALGSFPV